MLQMFDQRRPRFIRYFSGGIIAFVLSLFLVTQGTAVQAALARNIGSLYLIDGSDSEHLAYAERWLSYSLTLSEASSTFRLLGKARQARGDIVGAMQQWRDAGLVSFAVDIGMQELAQANTSEALVWQQQILDSISEPGEWQRLGTALRRRGDYEQAVDAYQHALDLLISGRFDKTQVSLSEIHYRLAEIYRNQFGDVSGAIDAYSAAVKADDFHNAWHRVLTHQELAVLLIGQDSERAVLEARRAVELKPDSPMGHSILGLALYTAYGDLEQAEQEIRLAIDLAPQAAWPWMHLGQLYFQAQQYELAVTAYLQAAELNPNLEEAHNMATFIRNTYLGE